MASRPAAVSPADFASFADPAQPRRRVLTMSTSAACSRDWHERRPRRDPSTRRHLQHAAGGAFRCKAWGRSPERRRMERGAPCSAMAQSIRWTDPRTRDTRLSAGDGALRRIRAAASNDARGSIIAASAWQGALIASARGS